MTKKPKCQDCDDTGRRASDDAYMMMATTPCHCDVGKAEARREEAQYARWQLDNGEVSR